jgi:hypothetical protein
MQTYRGRRQKRGEFRRKWGQIGAENGGSSVGGGDCQRWGRSAGNGGKSELETECVGDPVRSMLGLRDRESWVGGSSRNPVDLGGVEDLVPVCDRAGRQKRGKIGAPEKGEIGQLMGEGDF